MRKDWKTYLEMVGFHICVNVYKEVISIPADTYVGAKANRDVDIGQAHVVIIYVEVDEINNAISSRFLGILQRLRAGHYPVPFRTKYRWRMDVHCPE